VQVLKDYEGREIRLTDERIRHISARHPRVFRIPQSIELTLQEPDTVDPSFEVSVHPPQPGA
jgi:hypothetical protein